MGKLIDDQPKGGMIVDNRPSQGKLVGETTNRMITRGVEKGMAMGLLLAITYSADETFTTEYNP